MFRLVVPSWDAVAEFSFRKPFIAVGWEHGLRPLVSIGGADAEDADDADDDDEEDSGGTESEGAEEAEEAAVLDPHAAVSTTTPEPSSKTAQRRRFMTDSRVKAFSGTRDVRAAPKCSCAPEAPMLPTAAWRPGSSLRLPSSSP
jgi:hypothetical protein